MLRFLHNSTLSIFVIHGSRRIDLGLLKAHLNVVLCFSVNHSNNILGRRVLHSDSFNLYSLVLHSLFLDGLDTTISLLIPDLNTHCLLILYFSECRLLFSKASLEPEGSSLLFESKSLNSKGFEFLYVRLLRHFFDYNLISLTLYIVTGSHFNLHADCPGSREVLDWKVAFHRLWDWISLDVTISSRIFYSLLALGRGLEL